MNGKNYTVQTKIGRPVADVFDAIVNESTICRYFTDRTSGPLVVGQTIAWHWKQWGDFPVVVREIVENQRIHLQLDSKQWKKTEKQAYPVDIFLELESLEDGSTMLSISEHGWPTDDSGLKGSHDNCSGWTHMAMCLKAYLEHGIDLR
jgi:uncharacterized protein YndB with AHSA1/START domain